MPTQMLDNQGTEHVALFKIYFWMYPPSIIRNGFYQNLRKLLDFQNKQELNVSILIRWKPCLIRPEPEQGSDCVPKHGALTPESRVIPDRALELGFKYRRDRYRSEKGHFQFSSAFYSRPHSCGTSANIDSSFRLSVLTHETAT